MSYYDVTECLVRIYIRYFNQMHDMAVVTIISLFDSDGLGAWVLLIFMIISMLVLCFIIITN